MSAPAEAGHNYHITPADGLGAGGKRTKYKDNLAAIRLVKQLAQEGRKATPAEQAVLVKYVGWGSLPEVFDTDNATPRHQAFRPDDSYGTSYLNGKRGRWVTVDSEWYDEYQEVKALMTPEEYKDARASTTNAHYTSYDVTTRMWDAVKRLGFDGGKTLEPAAGIGNFIGTMPPELFNGSRVVSVEKDKLTGDILGHLYQGTNNHISPYQKLPLPVNYFDLAISNVPFGNFGVADAAFRKLPKFLQQSIHNYYFAKALTQIRPGGLIAFITSAFTMDAPSSLVV